MNETKPLFPDISVGTASGNGTGNALPPIDGSAGLAARDAGIAKVAGRDPSWQEQCVRHLLRWARERPIKDPDSQPKFALEEFVMHYRMVLKGPEPHHPNAWGAITKHPDFKAHIGTLGETRRSYHKAAKARRVLLYFMKPGG